MPHSTINNLYWSKIKKNKLKIITKDRRIVRYFISLDKLYSKDVTDASSANVLLHADNDYTDDGSVGVTVTTPGTYNSASFSTVNKLLSKSMKIYAKNF